MKDIYLDRLGKALKVGAQRRLCSGEKHRNRKVMTLGLSMVEDESLCECPMGLSLRT